MAASLDLSSYDTNAPCFMLVKTTTSFKDLLTKAIGTSYDFLSDASSEIGTMMNGNPVVLTTADITNEILNDSSLSQQVYTLLTAKGALIIFDHILCLLQDAGPYCLSVHSQIDPLMTQRINCFLEATFESQQDQSIRNKVKYLMLLLSDLMFKYRVSPNSVVTDSSSEKQLASVCKCIEKQLKSDGDDTYDMLSGKGEASDVFFKIVQPQQKSTVREKGKRSRGSSAEAEDDPTLRLSDLATVSAPSLLL